MLDVLCKNVPRSAWNKKGGRKKGRTPSRVESVRVVKIRQGREVRPRPSRLVRNDDPPLPARLNIVSRDYRSHPPRRLVHQLLVNLERVARRLLEERLVAHLANRDARLGDLLGRELRLDKVALGNKVRTELRCVRLDGETMRVNFATIGSVRGRGGAVRLETPGVGGRRDVDVLFVDAALVLRAVREGDTGRRGEDVDGRVLCAA